MSDLTCTRVSALAKASIFPALYLAFFVWSYAVLLHA
jgi:hypothetical protein